MLDTGDAAGREEAGDLRREEAVIVEPVRAGEERGMGLPSDHVRIERRGSLDIGRIAQDEVERTVDPFRPIALPESGPRREVELLGIAAGKAQRLH